MATGYGGIQIKRSRELRSSDIQDPRGPVCILRRQDFMNKPNIIILILGVLLSALGLEFGRAAESVQEVTINIPYKRYILTNGLTLIVHEDHKVQSWRSTSGIMSVQ